MFTYDVFTIYKTFIFLKVYILRIVTNQIKNTAKIRTRIKLKNSSVLDDEKLIIRC